MGSPGQARDARASVRPEHGQATVEFALVLPLFVVLIALVLQVAFVARDEIVAVHAAREAAREATLTGDLGHITAAAQRTLPGAHVRVLHRGAVGEPVEVEVTYVARVNVPLLGFVVPDLTLNAHAVMRVERP